MRNGVVPLAVCPLLCMAFGSMSLPPVAAFPFAPPDSQDSLDLVRCEDKAVRTLPLIAISTWRGRNMR
jgi:hypothetical protein